MSETLRHFQEKQLYQATCVKQSFIKDGKGVETLVLDMKLEGMLVNRFEPSAGLIEDVPKVNVEVRVAFPTEDAARFKMAARDLVSLGYEEEDLEALNPINRGSKKAKFFEIEGRTLYVTPSYKTYSDAETCFWNLRFPRGRKVEEIPAGHAKKSATAEVYRAALKELRETAASGSPF